MIWFSVANNESEIRYVHPSCFPIDERNFKKSYLGY